MIFFNRLMLVFLFFIHFSSLLWASEESDYFELSFSELMNIDVISSTRKQESLNAAPNVIFAITAQQIKARGYKTLLDVLQHVPGWDFDSPQGGWVGQYSYIRGTRGLRHVLLSVDGVVQNNINDFESGRFHTYPLASIKQIEIINGPASPLYGANALLGIINIISKKPDDIDGVTLSASATSANSGSDNWFKQDINLLFGKTLEQEIGIVASLDLIHSNDDGEHYYDPDNLYRRGTLLTDYDGSGDRRRVPDDGFDNHQDDYHFKLRINQNKVFELGFDYSDIDEGLGSFLSGSSYFANSSENDFKWHTKRLSSFIRGVIQVNEDIKIEPKIYYREDELKEDTGFAYLFTRSGRPPGTFRSWQQHAYRFGFDLATSYNPSDEFSLLLGYNYESDNTESESSSWGSPDPRQERTLHSGFMQTIVDVTENLTFLLGTRYDDENEVKSQWMPRTGLVYTFDSEDKSQLITKLLYGESFRALATYEKEPNQDNPSSPGVVPEHGKTYEIQVIYLPNEQQKYDVSLWHTSIKDLRIDGTSGVNRIDDIEKNYRDQTTWGLQASVDIELSKKLEWVFNYTYTNGKNDEMYYQSDQLGVPEEIKFNDLIHIPKHKFNVGINYKYNPTWMFNMMFKYVGKKDASPFDAKFRDNASYDLDDNGSIDYQGNGHTSSYVITDLTINYRPHVDTGLSGHLTINNLLDEEYVDMRRAENWWVPYYHPQAGRTIVLGLQYSF